MKRRRRNKSDAPKHITQKETELGADDFIVSKTDPKGIITYGNRIFVDISGYSREEIIGANHNLIRHPDMPKVAFALAWELIKVKKEFFGFVKNLRKDGGYYWVFAYITPDLDTNGNIIGYTSFRRRPSREGIEQMEEIYSLLKAEELHGGVHASKALLTRYLDEHETTYDKFVHDLQLGVTA